MSIPVRRLRCNISSPIAASQKVIPWAPCPASRQQRESHACGITFELQMQPDVCHTETTQLEFQHMMLRVLRGHACHFACKAPAGCRLSLAWGGAQRKADRLEGSTLGARQSRIFRKIRGTGTCLRQSRGGGEDIATILPQLRQACRCKDIKILFTRLLCTRSGHRPSNGSGQAAEGRECKTPAHLGWLG